MKGGLPGTYEGHVVFNDEIEYPKRNKETFKQLGYNDHQNTVSPLTEVEIDAINLFPLDYIHLVCLGAVQSILNYLKKGPGGKISANQINEISSLLVSLNGYMAHEFSRLPRSLKDLDRWKATESWQFLLYTGRIVLQDIISDNAYDHFLASSTILLQSYDQTRCQYLDYARDLIRHFVYNSKYVYGNTFTVYKILNLLHLPDDCFYHKSSLKTISCFPFENFLQGLKKVGT